MMLRRFFNRLNRRLFWKIFGAFWLAITVAGAALLAVENTRAIRLAKRWRGVTGDALAVYAATAAQSYQNPHPENVRQFLANVEKRTSIRAWLFDARGREVSRYAPTERNKLPLWMRRRMLQLVLQAARSDETEFADLEGITLAARSSRTANGRVFVLAGVLPDARYPFWGAIPAVQAMRFLALLAVAGSASWLLARHLTSPLEALRSATRRLAEGDFSARASGLQRRRDELAGLAMDFNHMAEHIDNLLRRERRLILAQRRLLADVAHELRSPIARVNVAVELAREALEPREPEDRAVKSLDRIERESERLTELINRLLVVSRLESGFVEGEFVRVDLAELVEAIAADADFEAHSTGRSVEFEAIGACPVLGAPNLLQSAIENVVRNAIRHTPEQTAVHVAVRRATRGDIAMLWGDVSVECYVSPQSPHVSERGWAVVTVRDHGPGLPADELGEIFRPFYRARGSRDRKATGAGLGLTITARAIELHGGQYRVCNVPDGGLQIELRLPVADTTTESTNRAFQWPPVDEPR